MKLSLSPSSHVFSELTAQWQPTGARVFLFAGPTGVGRAETARWFAQWLNCGNPGEVPCGACESCRLFALTNHPDFVVVKPVRGRGEHSRIGIEQLVEREGSDEDPLSAWLDRAPMYNWRVAVIDDAHTMTPSAANAFLKRLEEPPSRSVIILTAPDAGQLLPTVASRVVPFRFPAVRVSSPIAGHPAEYLGQPGLLTPLNDPDTSALVVAVQKATEHLFAVLHDDLFTVFESVVALQEAHTAAVAADATSAFSWVLERTRALPAQQRELAQEAVYTLHEQLLLHANPTLSFYNFALTLRRVV